MMPMVPELVREIKRARSESGMGLNELLKGLREQRERYHKEKYAPSDTLETRGCF
jgi:hypothetical protein